MPRGSPGDEPWAIPPRRRDSCGGPSALHLSRFWDLPLAMMVVRDFEGFYLAVNATYQAVLGWSEDELLSRPYWDWVHPDDRDRVVEDSVILLTGGTLGGYEFRMACRDGSYLPSVWNAAADAAAQLVYAVGFPLPR